ncbi:nucleoside 2-deoxyribosyltransferase [Clostridium botulinum]|uniref:Nucleoside 2-deoxyribosyltransferase n=2 Tax=Clostridium botulinum TaxID=1491 RepID=A0A846I1Q0_CLOBO|nr:cytidine deoxyribosyltransferase [Clostridium botulinum]ACQ51156.1 putative cytidine deoxyribosyltransferase [Clostridium botulinum Ba4 str. 657]AJE13279.1 hypothetical protein T259_4235 [Clostridium botulinum CDC_1436]AXG90316.1 nucleoside 2-deoxyribosyltransferase [Clostridium botulinum]EDT84139.1 putative cytidine deoxyribosyltransferase [Clostridium botulinum Bf]MBY6881612.1 nucleoside 2-deoxyribosyltransferase [Clostridium botulinum]
MSKNKTVKRGEQIFLSTPISKAINPETGLLHSKTAVKINRIFDLLTMEGYNIFLAIDIEKWGRQKVTSVECTKRDYDELVKSKHLVAIVSDYISDGVLIELGWASAHKIPITIIADYRMNLSHLILGLPSISDAKIYQVDWKNDELFLNTIFNERGISISQ